MIYRFGFPIRAVPKQSFRAANGHGYQPKKVVDFKRTLQLMLRAQLKMQNKPICEPLSGAVKVCIEFVFQCPKNRLKSLSAEIPKLHKDTRPDLDNLCKAVWDAFNGIVWQDDSQVAILITAKWYGKQDEIIVIVEDL